MTKIPMGDVDPDRFRSLLHYVYKGRLDKSVIKDGTRGYKRTPALLRPSHEYGQMDLFTECKDK